MEFGLFVEFPANSTTTQRQIFKDSMELIDAAEESGSEGIWLAEYHFNPGRSVLSAPVTVAAAIAARTKRVKIGLAVHVLPLRNPVQIAEEIATLDHLSDGRLDFGIGRAAFPRIYQGYGLNYAESRERFDECLEIILKAWTTDKFSFHGKYYQFDEISVVPQPLQKPHPPMYIAATRTRETQEFVAGTGHPLIVGVVLDTVDALALCHTMVDLSKQKGKNMTMGQIPFFRYFYVAETEEQAKADSRAALDWNIDMIQWRRTFDFGSEVWEKIEDFRKTRTELPPSYDYLYENRAFIGSPDQIIAKIKALQDQGIEYFGCNFSFGGMPQDKVLKSMRLFAKEVMPAFK